MVEYDSDADLEELIRGRLGRGFNPDTLPVHLANEFGVDHRRVQVLLDALLLERQRRASLIFWRRLLVGVWIGAGLFLLWMGKHRDERLGTVLLVASIGCGAWLMAWMFATLLTSQDPEG